MSYLTESEVEALHSSSLNRDAPFSISYISHGYFSVARHYGAATYKGAKYTYAPATDELIRDDVLKFVAALRKPKKTQRKAK